MEEFLAELLTDFIISPIVNLLFGAICWLVRTGTLLLFYPLMLLSAWLRLWVRQRDRVSLLHLWRQHGRATIYRFGWAVLPPEVEYAIASCLLVLACAPGCIRWGGCGFYKLRTNIAILLVSLENP